jgi:hypothetical protein
MKKAKQRTPPILARLISSTRQANRSIDSALAYVAKSNRRLAKRNEGKLEQLMAEMPGGLPVDRAWDCLTPVGQEVVDSAAVVQMQAFMASAPSEISQDALKDLINEGRD